MIELLFALREFCLDAVKDLSLESKDRGELPPVRGYIGDIPGTEDMPPASDFPLLIFRLINFEDPESGSTSVLTVRIIAGVYCSTENNDDKCSPGYHDLLNMLQRLRQSLLKDCDMGGRWRRVGKLEGGPFEYQAYPYCFGDIILQYDERQHTEEFSVEEEIDIYGTGYGNDNTENWQYPK